MNKTKGSDIIDKRSEYMKTFSKYSKEMLRLIEKKDNDEVLHRARKRLEIIDGGNPAFIIDNLGPYLVLFKDKILDRDPNWFINRDYKDLTQNEYGDLIIKKLKEKWSMCCKDEQSHLADRFTSMLTMYCEYKLLK
jgi:phage terminase Nu1 subunit (DNA packaging protein)